MSIQVPIESMTDEQVRARYGRITFRELQALPGEVQARVIRVVAPHVGERLIEALHADLPPQPQTDAPPPEPQRQQEPEQKPDGQPRRGQDEPARGPTVASVAQAGSASTEAAAVLPEPSPRRRFWRTNGWFRRRDR